MPVSGLVLTLSPDPTLRHRTLEQLARRPQVEVAPADGNRLPIVLDTPEPETDKRCWRWLHELEGVEHVDVAFIHFEDTDACAAHGSSPQPALLQPTLAET